ncbi:flagellar assembly protein FliW [Orlajensenia leifsoniae]|uniref:Flagellar assembly protein FliW n=1 Tax=Orlajensenia leifsoniae TaxID=2561933 RepID=A0A4Y9R3A6_9MICO|nr:flagellar assembly protein FliW [Leifsonia flava]TFV98810.1 flagellar assembly protein FliW [Leifsonia flava]
MIGELRFLSPPPGLEPATRFSLQALDGAVGVFALRSEDDPGLRLFVLDAPTYVSGYTPELGVEQRDALQLGDVDPVVLVVSSLTDSGPTVNLAAPIMVNPQTGAALQVILDGQDWPLRHALTAASA